MPDLTNYVTADEATYVRRAAASITQSFDARSERIWRPRDGGSIRVVYRRDGRARCRACGEVLPSGSEPIMFGFATHPSGRVIDAYLHAHPCERGAA